MDFKNTFTKAKGNLAMTLPEMLISMGIGGIVLTAVASLTLYTARSFAALVNYVDLDNQSRNALDQMSWKIRNTKYLGSYTTNYLSFNYLGGTLTYTYSPSTKMLTENWNGASTILLSNCNTLSFTVYQRTTASGTFDQYTTTDAAQAKVIQVSWQCSKSILGTLINSESVQSAKIIMRNH